MKLRIALLLAVVVTFSVAAAVAVARVGGTIAGASTLPVGQQQILNDWENFWLAPLGEGDILTIDYDNDGQNYNGTDVEVWVFPPGTTDYTFRHAETLADSNGYVPGELRFTAPSTATYIVEVTGSFGFLPWRMTAYVRHRTTLALHVPQSVFVGDRLTISGSLTGSNVGNLPVSLSLASTALASVSTAPDGSFSYAGTAPPTPTGRNTRMQVRATFDGDGSHLAATPAAAEVEVALHSTRLTLSGPRIAKAKALVTFTGRIAGVASGRVAIQRRVGRHWTTLGLIPIPANGHFKYRTRAPAPGKYRYRGMFFGDDSHLPASASLLLQALRTHE